MIDFEWDEENREHIARHGITPKDVEYVLARPTYEFGIQDWHDEERFAEAGMTSTGRILVVVTTWRNERIRVVTAYDAGKTERRLYSQMMRG